MKMQSFLEGPKAALVASKDFDNGHYKTTPQHGIRAFGRVYSAWAYGQTVCYVKANLPRLIYVFSGIDIKGSVSRKSTSLTSSFFRNCVNMDQIPQPRNVSEGKMGKWFPEILGRERFISTLTDMAVGRRFPGARRRRSREMLRRDQGSWLDHAMQD